MRNALFICLALLVSPAQAAIYKYVDGEGNITFTDRYRPGAVKLVDTPDSGSPTSSSDKPRKRASANPSPANFPKVDKQTQSKRDDVRRSLLLEERKNEETALAGVLSALTGGKRSAAESARLQESRRLHEKNIEMLDKELARIK